MALGFSLLAFLLPGKVSQRLEVLEVSIAGGGGGATDISQQ